MDKVYIVYRRVNGFIDIGVWQYVDTFRTEGAALGHVQMLIAEWSSRQDGEVTVISPVYKNVEYKIEPAEVKE